MATAISLAAFLRDHRIDYKTFSHRPTASSFSSAVSAGIPSDELGKAVLMRDKQMGYLLAVIPGRYRLALSQLNHLMHKEYQLATQQEVNAMFADCEAGAIPALGQVYNLPMAVDDSLLKQPHVFIEAGDHRQLIRLQREDFNKLMSGVKHAPLTGIILNQPKDSESMFSSHYQ